MSRPLAVHIDRLVIDEAALGGVALTARTRQALQAALEQTLTRELAARLASGGLPLLAQADAVDWLSAGTLRLAPGADAAALGRGLGTQVASALQMERPR